MTVAQAGLLIATIIFAICIRIAVGIYNAHQTDLRDRALAESAITTCTRRDQ